jgi:stage V sporulation protein G
MESYREQFHSLPALTGLTATIPAQYPLAHEGGLCITEVRIALRNEDRLKAFVSVTLNQALVIRGIKIIEGRARHFVAMPSRSKPDGSFQDIVHPINHETRHRLESYILQIYQDVIPH